MVDGRSLVDERSDRTNVRLDRRATPGMSEEIRFSKDDIHQKPAGPISQPRSDLLRLPTLSSVRANKRPDPSFQTSIMSLQILQSQQ